MKISKYARIIALVLVLCFAFSSFVSADVVHPNSVVGQLLAAFGHSSNSRYISDDIRLGNGGWMSSSGGAWTGRGYYTEPTTSTVDSKGNVTNYYRSGNTTNVDVVNTINKTFNSYFVQHGKGDAFKITLGTLVARANSITTSSGPSDSGSDTPAAGSDTAGMSAVLAAMSLVTSLVDSVWRLMTSNALLTVFLAASLVALGVNVFQSIRRASNQ